MKINGLRCDTTPQSGCSAPGTILPLDHYEPTSNDGTCRRPPFPVEWIRGILRRAGDDAFHAGGRITATRLLGCPRQTILCDTRSIAVDVRKMHSADSGSRLHASMLEDADPGAYTEIAIPGAPLFGVKIGGRVDTVRSDLSEIRDWKFHGEKSQGFKRSRRDKGLPDRELAAQLNIYRLLIARSVLHVPDNEFRPRLTGWHLAMTGAPRGRIEPPPTPRGARGWVPEEPPPPGMAFECPIMTEDEIARLRPFDDDNAPGTQPYTVREIVGMYVAYRDAVAGGADPDAALKAHVPLVGRGVWRGTMCSRYCIALEECDKVEGIVR